MIGNAKCANCDNTDHNTLWDEGDTIYCSKCHHRTRTEDGEDDLVQCPVCHNLRDRKAYYCMNCGSSWGPDDEYDPDVEDMVDEFLESKDDSDLRYGKIKKKK